MEFRSGGKIALVSHTHLRYDIGYITEWTTLPGPYEQDVSLTFDHPGMLFGWGDMKFSRHDEQQQQMRTKIRT